MIISSSIALCVGVFVKLKVWPNLKERRQDISSVFWTLAAIAFAIWMVRDPQGVFNAAQNGLQAWWNIVFPALLPFFIVSELLMNFGAVNFLGVLLQPIMRPLFNLPGTASFVIAIGYTSGYPIGSMLTAQLREKRLITRLEGERLMAFSNNASPLFMLCAVAVGMFNNPALGIWIAVAHYLANLTIGVFLRFYGRNDPEHLAQPIYHQGLLRQAVRELLTHQRTYYQPLGATLRDAIKKSLENLLTIGGFIIIFAVIINIMNQIGAIQLLAWIFHLITSPLGFSPALNQSLASGFFEITLGIKKVSETSATLTQQAVAISLILAWCGLSVQAQVASMISKTDLRMGVFLFCRLAQALLAALYILLLAPWLGSNATTVSKTIAAWLPLTQPSWWEQIKFYFITTGIDLSLLSLLAMMLVLFGGGPYLWFWVRRKAR